MNIIVAGSGHKGFLNPQDTCQIISEEIKKKSNFNPLNIPVTDGGEGFIDILVNYFDGEFKFFEVVDPLYRKRKAKIGLIKNNTIAIIEIAQAAGSSLLKEHEKQTMIATSYGVGEMIKKSYDYGCREFLIGLGGSIVSDCGIGLAQALGVQFFDKDGNRLEPVVGKGFNALSLESIDSFSLSNISINLEDITIKVASDSEIVLTGENGQARTYGPQKKSSLDEIEYLDKGFKNIRNIIFKQTKINVDVPYAGAGGGMGAGILGFLKGEVLCGSKLVADLINFSSSAKQSDFIIVSEGKLDKSTCSNKAPFFMANIAKNLKKKVVCITGKKDIDLKIFDKIYHTNDKNIKLDKSKIIENLRFETINFLNDIKNGVFNEKNK